MSTFKMREINVREEPTVQAFNRKGFTRRDEIDMAKVGKKQRFHVCTVFFFSLSPKFHGLAVEDRL